MRPALLEIFYTGQQPLGGKSRTDSDVKSAAATGHLDAKTHELIALAVAVTTRCDGCLSVHAEAAAKHGATREEIAEALGVAITLNTGAALVYSSRALDAFDSLPK
ncbi:carboxymuconolactone decarboxylase family protein [Klebsiella aerogenes]